MAEKTPPLLFRWRAAIRDSARSSTERLVAHVLSDYGNEHGEDIFPSVARLAHDSGLSDKCVRKTLKSLRGAGWLDWTERYNARGQDASLYRLLIPKDFAPDPFDPETERRSVSTPTETEPSSVTDPSETERRSSETEPGSSRDGTSFTTTSPSNAKRLTTRSPRASRSTMMTASRRSSSCWSLGRSEPLTRTSRRRYCFQGCGRRCGTTRSFRPSAKR
jgi:hypothetical protein